MDKRFNAKLLEKKYLSKNILIIGFEVPQGFSFRAGQFFNILFDPETTQVRRSYSILNPPSGKGMIRSCVKLVDKGFGSDRLRNMEIGQSTTLEAPLGIFVLDNKTTNNHHVFICTGTGITPFYSIIFEHLPNMPEKKFTLIYASTTMEELVFHEEFVELAKKYDNFEYIPTLTRDSSGLWNGRTGRVQKYMDFGVKGKTFYICGLKDLISDMLGLLIDKEVPEKDIHFERYS